METPLEIRAEQRVLFVGLVCVDLFQVLRTYPTEDLGHRCTDSYWQRGGNASNSATVFSMLGGNAEFFGTLSNDRELSFIENDFKECDVKFHHSLVIPGTSCPISVVIISQESRSRTVLHTNKNLPELTVDHFKQKIDLNSLQYGWIHFEGRDNAFEIGNMIRYILYYNETMKKKDSNFKPIIISLEAEKLRLRPEMDKHSLWQLPDVLFISKDFAQSDGFESMTDAVAGYFPKLKEDATLVCAWGEQGAAAVSSKTGVVVSPAFPPCSVIDTCGAGDTFNAAVVFGLSSNKSLNEAISFACKVAGLKCGIQGYSGLKHLVLNYV